MYLNAHSYYSLRYGTLSVEDLVSISIQKGHTSITLTDINNSTGALVFAKECKEKGIKAIIGIEFKKEDEVLFVGIAKNREGFKELNEILTRRNLHSVPIPRQPEVKHCFIIYPFRSEEHTSELQSLR